MSVSFPNEEDHEFEDDIFKQKTDVTGADGSTCQKEVIILGGKLLCSEIYSLMARAPEELHHIEIQTDMKGKFRDHAFDDNNRAPSGRKLKKSCSFVHEQKQRRKRDKSKTGDSAEKSTEGHGRDSVLSKNEFNELSVLTESFDTLARNGYLKTRFPPIFQESKSLLKRKQGEHKSQTATKEFLPALNIKVNLNNKIVKQTQGSTSLPALIHKQGLTVKAPPPSPECGDSSLSPTPNQAKTGDATFSEGSPNIPRKKPSKSYEDSTPPSPRRPTPFPSIWGEDRFFMISLGSNVMSEKAKTYIVKEEQE